MDKDVIYAKLDTLRRCVERIRSKTPNSANALLENYDLQDIISVNLERCVQLCVDIAAHVLAERDMPVPESMAGSFDELRELGFIPQDLAARLSKAVGFRNIAVHAYQKIDWDIVFSIITQRLEDFPVFARYIIERALADRAEE
jgi:uncharacterized protein YutE (UPF0331/DUF86 family)